MLFQAFFAKCAFRFPARSGLIPSWGLLGISWALLGRSWAFLGRFWAYLCSKWRFEAIFIDFSSILDGFGNDFSTIFRIFVKITIL